ncbi:hypothetical protein [uncultured Friedmanniella sp.]|uniref:AtpZ/AtpI family protein n=1 Tax=uncultured Friedmanniella sp. TaxID=335381 RepID=UPI0035CB62A1
MSQSREPEMTTPAGEAASAGMNQGMRVLSYLIAGVALYGGIGWGADHLLGTVFLLPIGLVAGAALAMYMIIKRFGVPPAAERGAVAGTTDKGRV